MEVSHFTDALSVSFFALLGIWAAVVRGHWFLRFAAVGSFLLITLLLPAYELVIEFGLQMAIIATGVWLARGRRRWRPRLSLETALLLTVVLAIVFAIVGQLPEYDAQTWLRMTGIGAVTGCCALLCLWIVFGRSRLWIRIVAGAFGVAVLVVLLHFGSTISSINLIGKRGWIGEVFQRYQWDQLAWWFSWNLKTTAIAVAVTVTALTLARISGWFAPPGDHVSLPATRSMVAARIGLSALVFAVAAPLFFILYRLLTPPPLPSFNLPSPNGYDDFIAAGNLMPDAIYSLAPPGAWRSLNDAQLARTHRDVTPVVERVAVGLQRESRKPNPYLDQSSAAYVEEIIPLFSCHRALDIHREFLRRTGTSVEQMAACLQSLRFGEECRRGAGANYFNLTRESNVVADLRQLLREFDAQACRDLAGQLTKFDGDREPHEHRQAVQAMADQHADWQTHLQYLMILWSGREPYEMDNHDRRPIAETRLLILDAALQAFALENGRPPDSLAKITPEYLDAVPTDPFDGEPLRYKLLSRGYKIYSVGYNGEDEGGASENGNASLGDITFYGPHAPPLWMRLRDGTAEGLKSLWKAAANAAEPAAE